MGRCLVVLNLAVHHKRNDGGNRIDNAEVLCPICQINAGKYDRPGHKIPPDFDQTVKILALRNAKYRCECARDHCNHH